ncbi:zinc-ribbon domain-containing protein [Halobacteria archaeon HArc-gm2]|nr:zinc-ribbon domain-containing protein [Halobacteria archaeon HArc-gm2]
MSEDEREDDRDQTAAETSDDAVTEDDRNAGGAASATGAAESAADGSSTASTGASSAASDAVGDTKYCTDCGAEISRDAEICPECGVRQVAPGSGSSDEKESGVSAVLSFLLPGVGQLYNGQVSRGAIVFVGWMVWEFVAFVVTTLTLGIFFLVWAPVELFVHVVAAYDAYDQAEKINAGRIVVD